MSEIFARLARALKITRLVVIQTSQRNIISIKRSWLFSPSTQPDAWKHIAHKPFLYPSRVFKPRNKIENEGPLPLLVMVHGGGFIMNNPSVDDPLGRFLADSCDCIVVNIDYRKAPRNPFPEGYEDVVESVIALLDESAEDLPIDRSKIVLCGSSAGGNLVLAAAQDDRLRGKILGVVAIYPVVNMVPTAEEQLATRPDPKVPDFLGSMWNDVLDIYVGKANFPILQDPRISPTNFDKRSNLPRHIYMLGCEHDMLCHEAKVMTEKLAAQEESPKKPTGDSWQTGDVRWTLVKGQLHGFDHFAKKTEEEEKIRLNEKDKMYESIAQWLRDVLA